MTLKLGAIAAASAVDVALFVASMVGNLNTALNVVTILIALGCAIPIIRSRRVEKAREELEKLSKAQEAYIEQVERERDGAVKRAERAEAESDRHKQKSSYLEGKLHAAEEYSAPQAFERMTSHLETLEHTMAEALRSTGELALRNTAILAAIAERLSVDLPDELKRATGR